MRKNIGPSESPPDVPEGPCIVCGNAVEDCTCTECTVCGAFGCIEHMTDGALVDLVDHLDGRLRTLRLEAQRREKTTPPCPKCGKEHKITIFMDCTLVCCHYEYDLNRGWEVSPDYVAPPPRECGSCKKYWFTSQTYGCTAGEQAVPTGASWPWSVPATCKKFRKGTPTYKG